MPNGFEMPVSSIFYMRDHGMVLAGLIRSGDIAIGNGVTIVSPSATKRAVVAGLERVGTREFLDTAKEGEEIAILCRGIFIEDISDGLVRVDAFEWKVVNLTVRSVEAGAGRWWNRIWPRFNH